MIGEYTTYRGDLTGAENYRVYGRVEGNCDLKGRLFLGPAGRWTGDIAAEHVVIAGEVHGDVYASARLELHPTARIHGNIASPVIAMAEGARYDGEIGARPGPRPQLVRPGEKRSA